MRFHRKLALSGTCVLVLFAVIGASQETSQETSQKELPEYCSKGGEIDWMAVLGKAVELYQNYASKRTASKARSPLEDILIAALSQKASNTAPQAPSESTANADAVNSAGTSQPDISAALLGTLLSNIGNADASSKKSTEADPMAGLKTLLDGLSALNSKDSGSAGQGAGSLDLSKLAPLVLQGLPSLLGSQGSGSQGSVLSLLGSLMGDQQSGQGLEKIFSQVLKTIFNPKRQGKDGNLAEGLEPALSGMIESLLKAGFKEDPSPNDMPKEAETPTLRSEL